MDREIAFILNEDEVRTRRAAGTVLLDFIRGDRRLTGTREGCREGDCGACAVLLGTLEAGAAPGSGGARPAGRVRYRTVASCLLPLAEAELCHVVTINGLNGTDLTPLQQAMVSEGASQCGFCTPGLVVSLSGFLLNSGELTSDDALAAIEGNICRCTGYASIRKAVEKLLGAIRPPLRAAPDRLQALIALGILPAHFSGIAARLRELAAAAPKARASNKRAALVVAGGTDLYVQRGAELPEKELLFLSRQEGLAEIWPAADRIYIGAAATVAAMMESPLLQAAWPSLSSCLRRVASAQIRDRATVGGNIVNASPIGDLSVILLALAARIGLRGRNRVREMALRDFFLGYKKLARREHEIVAWVSIPLAHDGVLFHFEKVARRRILDIASVNSALGLEMAGNRIAAAQVAAGGVAPVPLYLRAASAFLVGQEIRASLPGRLAEIAETEIAPISDVRGSLAYKKALLRRLLFAHFLELFPDQIAAGDLQ